MLNPHNAICYALHGTPTRRFSSQAYFVNGVINPGQIACIPQGYKAKSMFDETKNLAHYSGHLRQLSGPVDLLQSHVIFIMFFPPDALLSYCSLSDSHDSSRRVAHVHRLTHCVGLKCCGLYSESVQWVTPLFCAQKYCRRSSLLFCIMSTAVWVATLISIQITLHGVATILCIQITVQGVATLFSIQTPSSHTVRDN
jgi:hypothetical protein